MRLMLAKKNVRRQLHAVKEIRGYPPEFIEHVEHDLEEGGWLFPEKVFENPDYLKSAHYHWRMSTPEGLEEWMLSEESDGMPRPTCLADCWCPTQLDWYEICGPITPYEKLALRGFNTHTRGGSGTHGWPPRPYGFHYIAASKQRKLDDAYATDLTARMKVWLREKA